MSEHPCEEIVDLIGESCVRCDAPAVMRVKHAGRNEGPYWMCRAHGAHNVRNRNAEDITSIVERRLQLVGVQIGNLTYKIYEGDLDEVFTLLSRLEKKQ